MTSKSLHITIFEEDTHLNQTGVGLYVDALRLQKQDELPPEIVDHVEECEQCREKVFHYYQFKKNDDVSELKHHPYFAPQSATAGKTRSIQNTKNQKRFYLIAASITLIILLAASLYWINNKQKQGEITEHTEDSTKTKPQQKPIQEITPKEQEQVAQENQDSTPRNPDSQEEPEIQEIQRLDPDPTELLALGNFDKMGFYDRSIDGSESNQRNDSNTVEILYPIVDDTLYNPIEYHFDNPSKDSVSIELKIFTKATETSATPFYIKVPPKSKYRYSLPKVLNPDLYYHKARVLNNDKIKTHRSLSRFYILNKLKR